MPKLIILDDLNENAIQFYRFKTFALLNRVFLF